MRNSLAESMGFKAAGVPPMKGKLTPMRIEEETKRENKGPSLALIKEAVKEALAEDPVYILSDLNGIDNIKGVSAKKTLYQLKAEELYLTAQLTAVKKAINKLEKEELQ